MSVENRQTMREGFCRTRGILAYLHGLLKDERLKFPRLSLQFDFGWQGYHESHL